MKKIIVILISIISCSVSINAQKMDTISNILINAQKNYLYRLCLMNTQTIISFKTTIPSDQKKILLIKEILGVELQVENVVNIPFFIQEKCDSAAIKANVFFILLEETDIFIKKSGNGEITPNKATLTYKWQLKDNLLIFIFTNRELNHKFQKYIYMDSIDNE